MKKIFSSFGFLVCVLWLNGCGMGLCVDASYCVPGAPTVTTPSETPETFVPADTILSMVHRTKGTPQLTLSEEIALGTSPWPAGYRPLPLVALDTDGYIGGMVTFASRPAVICGTSQPAVEARIAECAQLNGADATWDGEQSGNGPHATWKLVTKTAGNFEVWRDERTQLLWSDTFGAVNWCEAAGVGSVGPFAEADPNGFCDSGNGYQDPVVPRSYCFEATGLNDFPGLAERKGGIRATATATSPAVIWRIPSRWDLHQADVDGIRFVLPNMNVAYWSGTVRANATNYAWVLNTTGFTGFTRDSSTAHVRCVGHAP